MLPLPPCERAQVTPFIKKFQELDIDGSGRLGMADLKLQTNKEATMKGLTDMAWKQCVSRQKTAKKSAFQETSQSPGRRKRGKAGRKGVDVDAGRATIVDRWRSAGSMVLKNPGAAAGSSSDDASSSSGLRRPPLQRLSKSMKSVRFGVIMSSDVTSGAFSRKTRPPGWKCAARSVTIATNPSKTFGTDRVLPNESTTASGAGGARSRIAEDGSEEKEMTKVVNISE